VLSPEHPNLKETIANMYETMYNAYGVGLAAPQVGLALRLFVIDTTPFSDDEELNDTEQKSIKGIQKNFINAKMIKKKEKNGALMKVV
jgi:peptide deformylase